jgi:hypothetical protein
MMNYVIDELRHKSKSFKKTGMIIAYNGDVVKSDIAISSDLKFLLRDAVRSLEEVPEVQKDYHPGSDEKAVDLVHPSLFPRMQIPRKLSLFEQFASFDTSFE